MCEIDYCIKIFEFSIKINNFLYSMGCTKSRILYF